MDLEDVLQEEGANNDGGLSTEMYYALRSDFTTIQWVPNPEDATDFEDLVTIDGDHVFKSGKCFKKIEITLERGQLVSNMVGERNSKSFENIATIGFPGNKTKTLGFLEYMKSNNLICLIKELDGQVRQLGWKDVPCHFDTAETTTGMAVSDFKGTNFTVKSIGRIAPVYPGEILLTPAA